MVHQIQKVIKLLFKLSGRSITASPHHGIVKSNIKGKWITGWGEENITTCFLPHECWKAHLLVHVKTLSSFF